MFPKLLQRAFPLTLNSSLMALTQLHSWTSRKWGLFSDILFHLILRDVQLPINSFINHYRSDFQRYCIPELQLQREGSMQDNCIHVQPNIFTNYILHWKTPNHQYQVSCTHENHQAYFTKVDMLKCSCAQLRDQVSFFALKRWTQRAGLMPKAKGQSCAESAELSSSSSGFKARGGISFMLYMWGTTESVY